ncbi:aquaporin-1-like [Synchiropus picturatus]
MSELKSLPFWRAVLAELLGTAVLVSIGISAAIGDHNNSYPDQEIKVAFAFGLAVATLAQCLGQVSGAHFNPAVTVGLLSSGQVGLLRALFYMVAQVVGAVAGSAIVYAIRPGSTLSLGVNKLNGITASQGVGVEFVLTLQLVLCVLAVTDRRRDVGGFAPLSIGLSVVLGHLAGISYTGCGINPARSLGPALIQESFQDHWVYWVGPMSAGVVAALLYIILCGEDRPAGEKPSVACCSAAAEEDDACKSLVDEPEG